MKITKFGHACLLIEEAGARILIDPGVFNAVPVVENLHVILLTHEHQDHSDVAQIQEILSHNPNAKVITHAGVAPKLIEASIAHEVISDGEEVFVEGISIKSFGTEHSIIYGNVPCMNTGFMIANRFFYPGDSFHVPPSPVEILALPTGGPWMKIAEAIDYAKAVAPRVIIPVHDAMHIESYRTGNISRFLTNEVPAEYRYMTEGSVEEF